MPFLSQALIIPFRNLSSYKTRKPIGSSLCVFIFKSGVLQTLKDISSEYAKWIHFNVMNACYVFETSHKPVLEVAKEPQWNLQWGSWSLEKLLNLFFFTLLLVRAEMCMFSPQLNRTKTLSLLRGLKKALESRAVSWWRCRTRTPRAPCLPTRGNMPSQLLMRKYTGLCRGPSKGGPPGLSVGADPV